MTAPTIGSQDLDAAPDSTEVTDQGSKRRPRLRMSRRRLRVVLLLAGLLPAVLAIVLLLKVSVMLGHDSNGREAYDDGDYQDAATEFGANKSWNWFESWVAPFNEAAATYARGVAKADDDPAKALPLYDSSIKLYRSALKMAPASEQCLVRTNLALTYESRGDATEAGPPPDMEQALRDWQSGMNTLVDGKCATDPGSGGSDGEEGSDGGDATSRTFVAAATAADEEEDQSDAEKVAERLRDKLDTDTDRDGLTDAEELSGSANDDYKSAPTDRNEKDSDGDGLTDGEEVEAGTDPNAEDTDGGGATDGSEVGKDNTDPLDKSDDKRKNSSGKKGQGKSKKEKDLDERNKQGDKERKEKQKKEEGGTDQGGGKTKPGGKNPGGGTPPEPTW